MNNGSDTGTCLRNLYAIDGGSRAVFSGKVADYVASRPDYPRALFDALAVRCPAQPDAWVADVGAGTGLFTQGLLRCGYRVVAVEPNVEMRTAADAYFLEQNGYRSVDGCAESMPLADGSVMLIAAAQAFHWFEVERARAEFLRVLTPKGQVALVWNDRVFSDPLHRALDEMFAKYGGAKRGALVAHEDRSAVSDFFGMSQPEHLAWPHEHLLDDAGLCSLVFSRSYMPRRDTTEGRNVVEQVSGLFHDLQANGIVTVRYQTVAIVGRPA